MLAYIKFRLQRTMRRHWRELRLARIWLANYFERHVWGKWRLLAPVRRFVITWWLVVAISFVGLLNQTSALRKAFLTAGPALGGVYREGLVGNVKSINPILPDSQASSDVGRLIFSGLTRLNNEGVVEPDLAKSWDVSNDGKNYTFHLRSGVKWHDKAAFTARDVLFTLHLIQNPDTRSPLASSWQGVTATVKDDQTIVFILPNAFAPFIYSTNFGVLPQHIVKDIDPASLRAADFNQHPVGTGPFEFVSSGIEPKNIILQSNPSYYAGAPKLQQFEFRLYDSATKLRQAFAQHQVNAISQVDASDIPKLARAQVHEMTLLNEVGLFMNFHNSSLADKAVRQAIAQTIDKRQIIKSLQTAVATPVNLPILPGQLGYSNPSPLSLDLSAAKQALDADGWEADNHGVRHKDVKILKLTLATANVGSYPQLARLVKANLAKIGIEVDVVGVDVATLQQSYIRPRKYDLLLYGISIGPDPDVYTFWQSSQVTDPGLNLSEYSSPAADKELEAARLTSDTAIRAARYKKFLGIWSGDVPAVMLYEPNYLYVTSPEVMGVVTKRLVDPSDRFYGVQNWTINTTPVPRRR